MFINNKYTTLYFNIIRNAKEKCRSKSKDTVLHNHHIIPKSMGGSNNKDNLVLLTVKEHRIVHRLLVRMTEGIARKKMAYALTYLSKSLGKERDKFGGYRRGEDNIFSTDRIKNIVKQRMKSNNPMKALHQRMRMSKNNPNPYKHPDKFPNYKRKLKVKFVTPAGNFSTKKEIIKIANIPEWTLNTIYNNLDSLPVSNGRGSKSISHLKLDYTKTWRENGFNLLR